MLKKIGLFILLAFMFVALFVFLASILLPDEKLVNSQGESDGAALTQPADTHEVFEFIPENEFEVEVYKNGKLLGIHIQKGDSFRIDSPERSSSFLYISGVKRFYLLDHKTKTAQGVFDKKSVPFYFDLYELFLLFDKFKFKKIDTNHYSSQLKNLKAEIITDTSTGKFKEGLIIDTQKNKIVERIELKYLKTSGISDELFFIPKDYSIVNAYYKR